MIITVTVIGCLVGAAMRIRWEDLVAFIGGPAVLLLIIKLVQDAFKPVSESASEAIPVESAAASAGLPLISGLLLICFIVLIAGFIIALLARQPVVGEFGSGWHVFHIFRERQPHAKNNTANKGDLYYATAVKLGAATAAADGHADPRELKALKSVFNLTHATCPEAVALYQNQLRQPESLSQIIKPFVAVYGRGSALCDTLIFGMTCVSLADGVIHPAELNTIRLAGDILGLTLADINRILMSAGYKQRKNDRSSHHRSSTNSGFAGHQTASPSERDRHLQTLNLRKGADKNAIRKAWRTLARKYHPDKLVSQKLPAHEMEKAEAMMQAINEAYDWLKEHGA